MLPFLTQPLDRLAIRLACSSIARVPRANDTETASVEDLARYEFFRSEPAVPAELEFSNQNQFWFASPVTTPWSENNRVPGWLHRAGAGWKTVPAVVLLHGWNGELGYRYQFPYLAWRLRRLGINTAMIELPYHGQRKPRAPGAVTNLISHDLLRTFEGTRQAVADIRALCAWLIAQGCPAVGLWGISLGAWLSGLVTVCDASIGWAVLLTPPCRMDGVVADLPFCEPIRRRLGALRFPMDRLNLDGLKPCISPENILIIKAEHDLFVPPQTLEELWRRWEQPEIWRVPHGHISVLLSLPILERIVRWIAQRAVAGRIVRDKVQDEVR